MSHAKSKSPTGDEPKHRYQCPAGHVSWERVNSHVWCHACARELETAATDVDPEWDVLVDTQTKTEEPVSKLIERWPDFADINPY
jgi:hypothetical protein